MNYSPYICNLRTQGSASDRFRRRLRPRRPQTAVDRLDAAVLAISVISLAEVRAGRIYANWGRERSERQEARLAAFLQLPLDEAILDVYAEIHAWSLRGNAIPHNECGSRRPRSHVALRSSPAFRTSEGLRVRSRWTTSICAPTDPHREMGTGASASRGCGSACAQWPARNARGLRRRRPSSAFGAIEDKAFELRYFISFVRGDAGDSRPQ